LENNVNITSPLLNYRVSLWSWSCDIKAKWMPQSRGPSWSWSYGNWFYNYLCNQCLSPL